ncbi:MAG: hypothetical protein GY762_09835 [Proteobacteria bacterium]|nr:hypothetical protein [Pseudomonadota bacterium]
MKNWARHRIFLLFIMLLALLFSAACGPGPYGYARYYAPTKAEKPFFKQAGKHPYRVVAATPDKYQDILIAWFGIVQTIKATEDGRYIIHLSHNKHKERHLCEGESGSSCRVTVHYKSTGSFSTITGLKPAEVKPGLDRVQPGTLMLIYGKVQCDKTADEQLQCAYDDHGGLLLKSVYYRQWPARYYVTTRAAEALRR